MLKDAGPHPWPFSRPLGSTAVECRQSICAVLHLAAGLLLPRIRREGVSSGLSLEGETGDLGRQDSPLPPTTAEQTPHVLSLPTILPEPPEGPEPHALFTSSHQEQVRKKQPFTVNSGLKQCPGKHHQKCNKAPRVGCLPKDRRTESKENCFPVPRSKNWCLDGWYSCRMK